MKDLCGLNVFVRASAVMVIACCIASAKGDEKSAGTMPLAGKLRLAGNPAPFALIDPANDVTESLTPISDAKLKTLRALSDTRIAQIRATPNMRILAVADRRYLSSHGDDAADGRTPATAWKTLARLATEKLAPGAYVLFERGGVFRGRVVATQGVTYTAYGVGPKPLLTRSPENGADPAKWTKTDVPNVWCYQLDPAGECDVGTLVFNDGVAHAFKVLPVYNKDGTFTQQTINKPFNNGYKDLCRDLDFWHDYSAKTKFQPHAKGSGKLYLYSVQNPGERFRSIEFNVRINCIGVRGDNVHVDNLCIKYAGAHGVGAGTVKGLRVTNCEFGWIGGSIQAEGIFNRPCATRYGNAVEIYGGCDFFLVDNCYIYEVYDAGITQQVGIPQGKPETVYHQKGMRYSNNVIERCNYSIEYFLSMKEEREKNASRMENFLIENNLMWDAAVGFCEQRPDRTQGAHIKSWRNSSNRATGYHVRNNLFARSGDMLLEIASGLLNPDGSDSMPTLEGNFFVGSKGQRFGVLNQGKPNELKYDDTTPHAMGVRGIGNVWGVR